MDSIAMWFGYSMIAVFTLGVAAFIVTLIGDYCINTWKCHSKFWQYVAADRAHRKKCRDAGVLTIDEKGNRVPIDPL